jgi:putative hydrolase of the HAD superfamily
MTQIKHIIFDLGKVIINVDTDETMKSIARRGISNLEEIQTELLASDTYFKLETGAISPDEFRSAVRNVVDIPYTDDEIDADWNAMLLDIPPERVKFMTRLKSKYKLYLLSNTNHIHWLSYDRYFQDHFDYPSINTFFTHCWYSYLMGVRKPDTEIFRMVMEEGGFQAGEVAFVDDLKENVDAAATQGMTPVHLPPGVEIMELFDQDLRLKI